MKLEFSWQIFEKILKDQISLKSAQWKPSWSTRTDGWINGQTDMAKQTVDFRNFTNAPKGGNAIKIHGRSHCESWRNSRSWRKQQVNRENYGVHESTPQTKARNRGNADQVMWDQGYDWKWGSERISWVLQRFRHQAVWSSIRMLKALAFEHAESNGTDRVIIMIIIKRWYR